MAKSARASRTKTNRAALRKRVFNPVDEARAERLSAKLAELAAQPKPERPEGMDVDTAKSSRSSKSAKTNSGADTDTSMDIDDPDAAAIPNSTSKKFRAGRVQKKRRGKATSTIIFPAYKNGRKVNPKSKKKH